MTKLRLTAIGPGTRNPEPSHNLNSPVGKLLGYKVSVGRLSRTALRWRNMYSIKQNPPSGGRAGVCCGLSVRERDDDVPLAQQPVGAQLYRGLQVTYSKQT
jgi:hypothetical protein